MSCPRIAIEMKYAIDNYIIREDMAPQGCKNLLLKINASGVYGKHESGQVAKIMVVPDDSLKLYG